jgi:hypothetical protein
MERSRIREGLGRERGLRRVTRNIDPERAADLVDGTARACICFAGQDGPDARPIVLRQRAGRYLAGGGALLAGSLRPGQEVVVLADEGIHWFDLRAVYIRGRVRPGGVPGDASVGSAWFEVVPIKVVAWDYGQLREEPNET